MDDREFSSPVCYLDYDNEQPVASGLAPLCERCKVVVARFDSNYECTMDRKYADVKIFEATIELATISMPACFLCRRFFKNVADFPQVMAKLKGGASVIVEYFYQRKSSRNSFILLFFRGNRTPLSNFTILDQSSDLALFNEKPLGSSSASDAAVGMALGWIGKCASKHPQCHISSTFLPTRLVDIGSKSNPTLRLVLGKLVPPGSRYLTLSHCWGGHTPLQLLTGNSETLWKEIDFHNLSRTFQDAVTLTRKLKCQYIWIDSLCIIQDNLADWHRESAQMGEIYRNSFCNISASAAKDGSEGLFCSRNSLMNKSESLLLFFEYSREKIPHPIWDTSTWSDNVERCSLNLRGWVCQERFLSPSNLHFGSDQLFWECKELTACETFPEGFPERIENSDTTSIKRAVSKGVFSSFQNREDERYETWNTLLGNYTASKVTFAQDKLVAFSGLAAMWAESTKDEYLAGLWKSRLPRDLLWHTLYPRIDYEHREYVAPSWSWASMDGEVIFDLPHSFYYRSLVKIISADIKLLSGNQFGQVKSGFLRLKGLLAPGWYHTESQDGFLSSKYGSSSLEVFWDRPKGRRMYLENLPDSQRSGVALYLLTIGGAWSSRSRYEAYQGLVLRRAETDALEFVRLGVFYAPSEDMEKVVLAWAYFDTLPESMELDREVDAEGGVEYIITLI